MVSIAGASIEWQAGQAQGPEGGLADLAFLTEVFPGPLPARVRWTAQNAVLAARDTVLPGMVQRDDPAAVEWREALATAAAHLGVALPDA